MRNRVLLVSPYSEKKIGGIGTWTKNILDYQAKFGKFEMEFLNTAFHFKPNLEKESFKRIFYGLIDSSLLLLLLIFKIIQKKPQTIHYTSSASFALIKDYFAINICRIFKVNFVIHWRFGRIKVLSEMNNWEWKILKMVIRAANTSIVVDRESFNLFKE